MKSRTTLSTNSSVQNLFEVILEVQNKFVCVAELIISFCTVVVETLIFEIDMTLDSCL